MNKFLFTDGMNGVKEAGSIAELRKCIENVNDSSTVRIWIFDTSEWISYETFQKKFPSQVPLPANLINAAPKAAGYAVMRKSFFAILIIGAGFLIFNFTKVQWLDKGSVVIDAVRPLNVPAMDVDSLVSLIEFQRATKIDRNTRNNLGLRNTWPDRLLLQAKADIQENRKAKRFHGLKIIIDNTTGLTIDEATVAVKSWKNSVLIETDTVHFSPIRYGKLAERNVSGNFSADSLSVSFESIRAKAFNFCYSASVENNSGNYNDRWFCRDK